MSALRENIKSVIFGTTTTAGKAFDIILIISILFSIILVMLDSVAIYHNKYGEIFIYLNGY
tara:strand:+ start:3585 stop:3767 length:183 start_codon:yes stop_codon:yes gene_type:complete